MMYMCICAFKHLFSHELVTQYCRYNAPIFFLYGKYQHCEVTHRDQGELHAKFGCDPSSGLAPLGPWNTASSIAEFKSKLLNLLHLDFIILSNSTTLNSYLNLPPHTFPNFNDFQPFKSKFIFFASPHLDFGILMISNSSNSNSNYFASPHLDFPILNISNPLNPNSIILPHLTLTSQF